MKLRHKLLAALLGILTVFYGCDSILDVNTDPNSPSETTEPLMLSSILSNFSYEVLGGWPVRTSSLWTKHTAYAVAGPHEGHYRVTENDVNNFWKFFSYQDVMMNCNVLINQAAENGNPAYSAIAKIIMAWNLSYITDSFGDVPYSDAFKGQEGVAKPEYDSQEEIYSQIQQLLDQAITEAGQESNLTPGSEDFVYGGAMDKWQNLARALKARFYLRLSNAPGYDAAEQADLALQALNAGAITEGEAPTFSYTAKQGAENPWYQYAIDGKWNTATRPSQYYVNMLKEMNDPRIEFQVSKVDTGKNAGQYVGVTNDIVPTNFGDYSAIASFYSDADAPLNWFIYAEVPFMRAEAEFLKSGKTVTPAVVNAYNAGIEASMALYGIDDFAAYLAANVLSPNTDQAYEQIMTQKYIANYLQFEPYNDFRRTGYPDLPLNEETYPDEDEEPTKLEMKIIPLRLPYPSSERAYNADNIPDDIPSGRVAAMEIPVWWDN